MKNSTNPVYLFLEREKEKEKKLKEDPTILLYHYFTRNI